MLHRECWSRTELQRSNDLDKNLVRTGEQRRMAIEDPLKPGGGISLGVPGKQGESGRNGTGQKDLYNSSGGMICGHRKTCATKGQRTRKARGVVSLRIHTASVIGMAEQRGKRLKDDQIETKQLRMGIEGGDGPYLPSEL